MSVYSRNRIYDYVCNAVLAEYEDAYVSSVFEPVPASFPSVFIREIGCTTEEGNVTFCGSQGVRRSTYEVQIYTVTENTAMSEAYDILDVVIAAFEKLYYIRTSQNVVDGGDAGVYRLVANFRRIIGSADEMPPAPAPVTPVTNETQEVESP